MTPQTLEQSYGDAMLALAISERAKRQVAGKDNNQTRVLSILTRDLLIGDIITLMWHRHNVKITENSLGSTLVAMEKKGLIERAGIIKGQNIWRKA